MGEVADDILNGLMCESCGVWMDDVFTDEGVDKEMIDNPPGHPRTCKDCEIDDEEGDFG